MAEYNYFFEKVKKVQDFKSPRDDAFSKNGDVFQREIELEDQILVETRAIVRTTIEVFLTAAWTDGRTTDLRVGVPIEYVEGFEDEIADEIIDVAREHVLNFGEGFERLDPGTFELEDLPFEAPIEPGLIEFKEKPVFETKVVEGKVELEERQPNIIEVGGRTVERAVGKQGVVATAGRVIQSIGKFIGRFFK